jgi:hypothetical protein
MAKDAHSGRLAKTAFKTIGELAFGPEGAVVGAAIGEAIDKYKPPKKKPADDDDDQDDGDQKANL